MIGDEAVVLLRVLSVVPKRFPLQGFLELDDQPVLLEPFVHPGEENATRAASVMDVPKHLGILLPLFPLRLATVGHALGLPVGYEA